MIGENKGSANLLCRSDLADVRYWPNADMPKNAIYVAVGGKADMPFCTAKSAFDLKRT